MLAGYSRTLDVALRHRGIVLGVAVATLGATWWLFATMPKGFFPEEDIGQIRIITEASEDTSFPAMVQLQARLADILRNDPNVATVNSFNGGQGSQNTGRLFINLKPRGEREPMKKVVETPAPQVPRGAGHPGLHAADPEPAARRPPEQGAVPVHPAERQGRRAERLGAEAAGADARRPAVPRRHQRFAAARPAGLAEDRPRPGEHARRLDRRHPLGAVLGLRRAPGVDHLHRGRQLPGDHGSRAGRQAGRGRVQQHLRALVDRGAGAAVELHDGGALGRADLDQPRRPAAGGDGVVQPRAGRRARRRDGEDREATATRSACRRRSSPSTAATRRCSRARRAARRS